LGVELEVIPVYVSPGNDKKEEKGKNIKHTVSFFA